MDIDRRLAMLALLGIWVLLAQAATADAPCYKGFRDTTASERANMTRVLEAARRAMPSAPPGWVIINDDPPSVPTSLCQDYERKPWPYRYSLNYQRTDKQAQIDETLQSAVAIMEEDQARKKPRMDTLQAKVESLSRQQIALMEKGDVNRALALNEQMASLQEQIRVVMDEGDAKARSDALLKEAYRDLEIGIHVQVNPVSESPAGDDAATLTLAGNPAAAFRWNSRNADSYQGGAVVLYGPWRAANQGGFWLTVRSHVPANFAHGVAVRVDADETRLQSVLAAIDFAALANLVAR